MKCVADFEEGNFLQFVIYINLSKILFLLTMHNNMILITFNFSGMDYGWNIFITIQSKFLRLQENQCHSLSLIIYHWYSHLVLVSVLILRIFMKWIVVHPNIKLFLQPQILLNNAKKYMNIRKLNNSSLVLLISQL